MSLLRLQRFINYSFLSYLFITFFFLYSVHIIRYHYDGHHIGLVYSNALDLINGKYPYKEIYIQYGFLTTLIHSLILLIFEKKIIFLSIVNSAFYSLSILLISLSIKNLLDEKYAFISSVILLFNHPIPWLPWSNYLAFFFLQLGVFLLTTKNKNHYLIGFIFGLVVLSRQDFILSISISFLFFIILYLFSMQKIYFKIGLNSILGFLTPITIFLIYLFYNSIFFYWKSYLSIPNYYLEIYQISSFNIIKNFTIFFLTKSFFNFIITPQYFLISIILISNALLIIFKIFKKINLPNNIFYFSLLCCFLSSVSLKIEIFRLYTSIIIGLIPLLYFLYNIKNQNLKSNLLKLLLLPSIFSIFFYPLGNNPVFSKIIFEQNNMKILNNKFDYLKIPNHKIKSINLITEISKKCNVEYLDNLTFDTLYSTISDYNRVRLLPYQKSSTKNLKFLFYIDSLKNPKINFIEKINSEIKKENIILLINENNNIYKNNKIIITKKYDVIKINESVVLGKPNILNIYLPKKCLN